MVPIPSWLAVPDRAVADDGHLRIDVHLRTPNVRKPDVEVLRRRAQ